MKNPFQRQKLITTLIFIILIFTISACEFTKSLWSNSYPEKIKEIAITRDNNYIIFLGENNHYVFDDHENFIKTLLALKNNHTVEIDSEESHFKMIDKVRFKALIRFKTFDLQLSEIEIEELTQTHFKKSEEENSWIMDLQIIGHKYKNNEDFDSYIAKLEKQEDEYEIEIRQPFTFSREIEDVVLTPFAISADALIFAKELFFIPFKE